MKNDVKNSKVSKSIKKTQDSTLLKKAVYGSLFLIGFTAVYKIVTKLWFVILLAISHRWLSLFILIIAIFFGVWYANTHTNLLNNLFI